MIYKNIFYTYLCPTEELKFSANINSCYSHYIKCETNDFFSCINNWSFLNNTEKQNKYFTFKNEDTINYLEEDVFLLKYEIRNAGHTLANILYQIKYYFDNNYNCKILIQNELMNISKYIYSIINLFINKEKIIIIEKNKIYRFNIFRLTQGGYTNNQQNRELISKINIKLNLNIIDIHIPSNVNVINYGNYFENCQHSMLDNMLINKIKTINCISNNTIKTYENICLIKLSEHVNEISTNANKKRSFERSFGNEYIDFFKNKNYNVINPSEYDVTELYILLNNAKNIVVSWGCISYINKMIIENTNINYILLSHKGYTHEFNFLTIWDMVPPCKKCFLIYNLESFLEDSTYKLINDVLEKK